MIIPSIDLLGGRTVQLIGGEELAIDAGDPVPLLEQFRLAGEVAVIDLDGARGGGSNAELIRRLVRLAPCRVGGGIRDVDSAIGWLDAGASRIILGTAATPDLLRELPPQRVIAALDARDGQVVTHGWRSGTGESVLDRMRRLEGLVGGFMVTFVECEGRLSGTRLDLVHQLREAAGSAPLTIAGGVTTVDEVAALHALGADAQVGMALYTGGLNLADAIAAPLSSDRPDGLWPTVVVDETGHALGLAYSSSESLREAVRTRRGVYQSRRRGVWRKGDSSGATQHLLRVDLDCDADALRFVVSQAEPGFCHIGSATCWGELAGIAGLDQRVRRAARMPAAGSYTARLLGDPDFLAAKLREEAAELADAQAGAAAVHEAADLLYFTLVTLASRGGSLAEVAAELDRRARRVTRRGGDAKTASGVSR